MIDETHTFSAGPGGYTAAHGLEPDLLTIGKAIGGGVPVGAFGVTAELAERALAQPDADYEDVGGVGGTLAGNALSLAAVRATLGEVLTEAGVRAHARARRAARGRRRGGDRGRGNAVARDPARRARRVPLHAASRPGTAASPRPQETRSSSASSTSTRSTAAS